MAQVNFDEFEEQETVNVNNRPLWTIKLDDPKNEENILKWMNAEIAFLKQDGFDRIETMRRHLSIYKNQNFADKVQHSKATQEFHTSGKSPTIRRITVNQIYDFVEQLVARLVRFKPAVSILPTNDEWEDKISAKIAEKFWGHIKELQKFDAKNVDMARVSKIGGEAYLAITWDPDAGGEHPDSKKLRKEKKDFMTLKDENGKDAQDEAGNVIRVPLPIRIGDVKYEVIMPWNVLTQKTTSWDKTEYMLIGEPKPVDELRIEFPKKADKIKKDSGTKIFDFERNEELEIGESTMVWTFWHKKTKFLPEGREMVFTKDVVLVNKELPYNHGKIPMVPLFDIMVPGQRHGRSFISNIRQLSQRYNDLTTMIMRNAALVTHPKWFVPAGSVKIESLGNDISIVQYKGQRPPVLGQQNATPNENFSFRKELKEDMQQIAGVFGVSRGEPPAGVKAGIALQFLEEQENQRQNAVVVQYNEYVVAVAEMTLDTASQFYQPEDDRTLMIMGNDGMWMTEHLDPEHLSKIFSIRIQNSSALPESKASRIQTVLDLAERFPNMIPEEQVIEMVGLANPQRFIDAGAAAVKKAQLEDELLLVEGKKTPPQKWEFHIQHWECHSKTLQGPAFVKASPENQTKFLNHLMAHEMLMIELAKINPTYAPKLAELKQFPLLFTVESEPSPPTEELPPPGGLPPISPLGPEGGGGTLPAAPLPGLASNPADSPAEVPISKSI